MNRTVSSIFRTLWLCLLLGQALPHVVLAGEATHTIDVAQIHWPSQLSDLTSDPSLVRGVLANGFRYIIKENHKPENRVAAYLAVLSGSREERDEQRGVAHFLEHLMFNGSTNFPPGTLVDYFQSQGMDFGGDTNAYTGFGETVYHLILPKGTDDELAIACKVLADYARGALLLDSEIDRERGVIFAEKRARDSVAYRNHIANMAFAFKGTRYPLRLPIGIDSVIRVADQRLLREYYDSWYRPDNMVLVLVGDLNVGSAEKIISSYFSGMSRSVKSFSKPDFGQLEHKGLQVYYRYEPELGKTNVSIETLWDLTPEIPSRTGEKDKLIQLMGDIIIGYRLQRQGEKTVQPYTAARYSSGQVVRRIGYGSLVGITEAQSWGKSLQSLHSTLQSAKRFGFTESEVARVKEEILGQLDKNVKTESSLQSRIIAARIVEHLTGGEVYMSPIQESDLYLPMLAAISLEDVNKGFKKIWDHPNILISVSGDVKLGDGGEAKIKSIYTSITQTATATKTEEESIIFPYLKPGNSSSEVQEKKYFPELQMSRYTLANGLVINLKKTDFEKNKIRLIANFGKGELDEDRAGMAFIGDDVVNLSGTKRLSVSELDSVLAGSSAQLTFRIGQVSNSWSGSALSSDFELLVQVLQAMLLDSGFDKVAFNKATRGLALMNKRLDNDIDGAVLRKVKPFFAGGNRHYGFPSKDDFNAVSFTDLQVWMKKLLDIKDLEISVVGDFDEDSVVALLSSYLADLKLGLPPVRMLPGEILFPQGRTLEVNVHSEIEKSTVFLSWPTDDVWDIGRTRRLSLLATILEDRMRKTIREKLGASYSPTVSSFGSRIHQGFGLIQAEVMVEGGKEDYLVKEIIKIVDQLVQGGITEKELIRAKKPVITALLDNVRTNQYWLFSVLSLSVSNPDQLIWPTTVVEDINSITTEDLMLLAGKYLKKDRVAKAIVRAGVHMSATRG